jgi:hypothetical protein
MSIESDVTQLESDNSTPAAFLAAAGPSRVRAAIQTIRDLLTRLNKLPNYPT